MEPEELATGHCPEPEESGKLFGDKLNGGPGYISHCSD
jgi:hypothetical protein